LTSFSLAPPQTSARRFQAQVSAVHHTVYSLLCGGAALDLASAGAAAEKAIRFQDGGELSRTMRMTGSTTSRA
jgi:hypothetical protein